LSSKEFVLLLLSLSGYQTLLDHIQKYTDIPKLNKMATNNVYLMTLKFTVVFVSLGLCTAQPILNNNDDNKPSSAHEDVLSDVTTRNIKIEQSHSTKISTTHKAASRPLIQLVVDNEEARRKWFKLREKILHDSENGANGHYVAGKDDDNDNTSSNISKKKRPARQIAHPSLPVAHAQPSLFTYPYETQTLPDPYPAPAPPPSSASATTVIAATEVDKNIQEARDQYRKSRFEGSAYALALKLSKAGNSPLSGGGSYSG
jgi:hypothetical protein